MTAPNTDDQRPTPRFVYVGTYTRPPSTSAGVYVYATGTDGALRPVQTVGELPDPSWVTLDPSGRTLYVTSELRTWNDETGGGVTAFAVDQETGELTRLNDQPTMSAGPAAAAVDPTGRHLVIANYGGGAFAVLPLGDGGELGPATHVLPITGSGPDQRRQREAHPHDVAFDRAGSFVLGADLGTDKVWSWRLDPAGSLAANPEGDGQVASGSGPRHLAFGGDGRTLYVINELSSSITVFGYDGARGTMTWLQTVSTLPAGFEGRSHCAEIAVHPGGRFLYGSNRGHDSIVVFPVDATSGRLGDGCWFSTGGRTPRNFAIDPSGALLLAANQDTDTIVPFAVDPRSGGLTPGGPVTQVPRPVCIAFGSPVPQG